MKSRILLLCFFGFSLYGAKAQTAASDSARAAQALKELLTICKNVDFADPKTSELGMFYKAAPYIIYRGSDETRKWKTFADYTKAEDKTGVDNICLRLNGSINMDPAWKIISYRTEKESEGVWHALTVSYVRKGVPKQAVVAFLKVNNRFGLGDID